MMTKNKPKISSKYVVIKSTKESLPGAIETLKDGGINYVVLPKAGLDSEFENTSSSVFENPDTGELLIPTGKVTVRWKSDASVLEQFLKGENAVLERNYGKGGIVSSNVPVDPYDFAEKLQKIEGITKTDVQILRRAYKR